MDSQLVEEDYASQNTYPRPYYPCTPSPMTLPYVMPPHGFSAMLTSPSSHSNVMFHPPSLVSMPQNTMSHSSLPHSPNVSINVGSPSQMNIPSPTTSAPTKGRKTNKKKDLGKGASEDHRGQAAKKAKLSKPRSQKLDVEEDEGKGSALWKDYWVDQLVHIRGGMNEEFNKPQKQGVDLWSKVASRLVSLYTDFDKDSESCRKKWARVYSQYKADKAHNAISGNDRKMTCKWFDAVDEYMHDRAHVVCVSHASSSGDGLPMEGKVENANGGLGDMAKASISSRGARGNRVLDDSLAKMAETGEKILDHLKATASRREALESRRLDLLEAMSMNMASFLESAKRD